MALPNITPDDFIGWNNIVTSGSQKEILIDYISRFTDHYLRLIIGDKAFISIQTQNRKKWNDLLNGSNFINDEGVKMQQQGLVMPVKDFIYFEYIRDNFTSSQIGLLQNKSTTADRLTDTDVQEIARSRYNNGVSIMHGIKDFLKANEKRKTFITESFYLGEYEYLVLIEDNEYLEKGEIFRTTDFTYKITRDSQIFEITGASNGIDFKNQDAIWSFQQVIRTSNEQKLSDDRILYTVSVDNLDGISIGTEVMIVTIPYEVYSINKDSKCFSFIGTLPGMNFTTLPASWEFTSQIFISIEKENNKYYLAVEDDRHVLEGVSIMIQDQDYQIEYIDKGFIIMNDPGMSFDLLDIVWSPYKDVIFKELDCATL